MAERIMYVQLKTGYDTDRGPSWIAWVRFSKTWRTAYLHGRTLRRRPGGEGNFSDVETGEEFWVSGPKRDRTDGRYGRVPPEIDDDARRRYEQFLRGAPLPGREHG
ncbi:hypothetical protein [Amycolatopsis sp. BJA-103]|uniref:hypothetical protein n=1 Tax=unclassified Amycolatopsis TaxID=2618356 RepID=UPI000C75742F|nr:hypothetical protein [Amycolatopsis sp. BJA-103]AUI64560.1 hypothetical protein BKN51_20065 [Amycolatopsis sp. BJA-103]PNE13123.1 hypothetical protein B1H26_42270 [Amycolatopsis sp. BJA-103]